jgi:ATP-dependent Clp protease protease subunit
MIHQPLAGMQGTAEDISIHLREFQRTKRRLNEILIKHCGQNLEQIERDTDRDRFMDPEEAVKYGLIDKVIDAMPTPVKPAV